MTLDAVRWPADAYDRGALPERVMMFGTGMLLRALAGTLVDAANRAGARAGRIVVVQSTPNGLAGTINAQDGLFTLVERGAENGAPVERSRVIGSISRALVASSEWGAVRDLAASPELRVIVSNVTEAGFRLDDTDLALPEDGSAPRGFVGKLADLLRERFRRAPDAPPLFVIPTELVDDNGPRLREMVERAAASWPDADAFLEWMRANVRYCSSLVDRITTGTPEPALHAELEARFGHADALLTVAEPYALWAIECDPDELHAALPIDGPSQTGVIYAPDIRVYRERKIRLLNGAHTALAPLALQAGVRTVREAVDHPALGAFLRRALFDEIAPSTELPAAEARAFAELVLDRFRNPWLDHEWAVIATNQAAKTRLRVVPSIVAFAEKFGAAPEALSLAAAAYLRHERADADVDAALADESRWGRRLTDVPGLADAIRRWLGVLDTEGPEAAARRAAEAAPQTTKTTQTMQTTQETHA